MLQPTRLISTPFAQEGDKTEIQNVTGEFDNSATYRLGFPPITMQSIRLGGKPPKGTDFNGILFDITENISFLCKGGRYQYNAGLSTLIGGYPEGSNLLLDDNVTEVVSTAAGNQNNPNSNMNGWILKPNKTTAANVLDSSGRTQQEINDSNRLNIIPFTFFGAVGDGVTDDTVAVKAALSSEYLNITGLGKTYKVTDKLVINAAGKSLIDFNILSNLTTYTNADGVISVTGNNVNLERFSIDGSNQNTTGVILNGSKFTSINGFKAKNLKYNALFTLNAPENFTIDNVICDSTIGGYYLGGAIQIENNSKNGLITNCQITGSLGKGFGIRDCENVTFKNCVGTDCIYENFAPTRGAKNIRFESCISTKTSADAGINSGLKLSRGANGVHFEQCIFRAAVGSGVVSAVHNQGNSNVTLDRCVIESNSEQAILASWHPEDGPTFPATPANHMRIKNCRISSPNGTCIRLDPSFGFDSIKDYIISGNVFESFKSGAIRSKNVLDLVIEDNEYNSQNAVTEPVVLCEGLNSVNTFTKGLKIGNNRFYDYSVTAIRTFYIDSPVIESNVFSGSSTTVTSIQNDNTDCVKISGNTFSESYATAINIASTSPQALIYGNYFKSTNGSAFGIRQNGIGASIIGNEFNISVPVNPIGGGVRSSYIGNSNFAESFGSAAPTTGAWLRGDKIYNTNIGSGATPTVVGWVCVTAGSPGTWSTIGISGITKLTSQSDSVATDVNGLKADFNSLLAKLRSGGFM